jgi:hypothetical protein
MSKLVEFGMVSTETKATYFQGTTLDGSKGISGGGWFYKFSDLDTSMPKEPAPEG